MHKLPERDHYRIMTPKKNSQHKGNLSTPEEQRARDKRQRQEAEDKGEGEGNKGEGEGVFVLEWVKDWLERRQMWP